MRCELILSKLNQIVGMNGVPWVMWAEQVEKRLLLIKIYISSKASSK